MTADLDGLELDARAARAAAQQAYAELRAARRRGDSPAALAERHSYARAWRADAARSQVRFFIARSMLRARDAIPAEEHQPLPMAGSR